MFLTVDYFCVEWDCLGLSKKFKCYLWKTLKFLAGYPVDIRRFSTGNQQVFQLIMDFI